jgi:molybdenum cofactor cytidylyltransferase
MSPSSRIVALVLAAGRSSRLGGFKPLAPLGSSTFIEEAVACFRKAGVQDVRVVVGRPPRELTAILERLGARSIENHDPDRGMFSSVLAGFESLEPDVAAFFLLPADMPLVRPQTIGALLDGFEEDHPAIVHPRFNGKRGHPPLIPVSCLNKDLPPDFPGGLRALLAAHDNHAVDVDVVDEAIHLDCDTPSDYLRIVERWKRNAIDDPAGRTDRLYGSNP